MLDELEKLAREATRKDMSYILREEAGVEYQHALVNAAPLLLAAVRAAEEVERWSQVHGVETVKDVAMDALRDALKALKGET